MFSNLTTRVARTATAWVCALMLTTGMVWAADPIKVVTTTPVLADFAKEVGGDAVQVISLMKPDVDPHDFTPSPSDLQAASDARVVLISGKGLESFLPKLKATIGKNATWVDVGAAVPSLKVPEEEHGHSHSHAHGSGEGDEVDPHWWHSVANAKLAVTAISQALQAAAPEQKDAIAQRTAEYQKKLDDLATNLRTKADELPAAQRKLVTSHDALRYFANDYGFTVVPIAGTSTETQPSAKRVVAIIGTIKKNGVKAVFFADTQNPKVVEQIARDTGAKVGGQLCVDGLAKDGFATYIDMMRRNMVVIVDGLK